jgi:hypothetical protein
LPKEAKRQNHPLLAYGIGFIVIMITLVVLAGVLHHLTFSHHGPEILQRFVEKFIEKEKSLIMDEAKRHQELELHRHFHRTVAYPQLTEDERPACFICHSDYPHSKNKRVRSLLNMHTQYFVCESCHIKEIPGTSLFYKWHSPFDENPKGPFLNTSYDPETGHVIEIEDKFSKITPFYIKGVRLESAVQAQDAPLAKDFVKVRDKLTPEQREGVKNKFHVNIKAKGHECKTCHSKQSILDFARLGFSENRRADLQQLNVKGMLTKYENFYLPDLFTEPEKNKTKAK